MFTIVLALTIAAVCQLDIHYVAFLKFISTNEQKYFHNACMSFQFLLHFNHLDETVWFSFDAKVDRDVCKVRLSSAACVNLILGLALTAAKINLWLSDLSRWASESLLQ